MSDLAFTKTCSGITKELINHVTVLKDKVRILGAIALWDTGSTITCISTDVASKLKLTPIGTVVSQGVNAKAVKNLYVVDIILSNNLTIQNLKVQESEIGRQGIDVLIGMDIISLGDFAVSNYGGNTVFTYRLPSRATTDYTITNDSQIQTSQPETPCICGSGEKYSECCESNI